MNINKDNCGEEKNTWVYLTTADNEFEYNIIKGKLTENKLVCIGKGQDMDLLDSGFLNIILGPCIPVEIMVPNDMYEEALQIINLKISDEELEEQAINSKQGEQDGQI
jgi:hypothetical protein